VITHAQFKKIAVKISQKKGRPFEKQEKAQ